MATYLIGKEHNAHLDWLYDKWFSQSNSPVCFLEGFSGTGKTTIARALLERAISDKYTAVMITAPESKKDLTDDLLLDLAATLNAAGRKELANAIENNRPLLDVLSIIINDPILIIIDEFQNTMYGPRSMPMGGFAKVLSGLTNRKWLKGRVLLLTNRLVERARWSESYAIRTVKGMSLDDGVTLLETFASEGGRVNEINADRRRDIIKWVGGNPRAIRTVVNNLAYESLDNLIGTQPELWELRDREVSSELVKKLEEELLEKTLIQLPDNYNSRLRYLSVIRKPFKRQAIELLFDDKEEYSRFRKEMIDRFLMEQYLGWFNLHPVVREICLKHIAHNVDKKRKAHSIVAPYYMRHFKASRLVGWGALGGHFVEARYHLIMSGKEEDLRDIASRFKDHIFSTLSSVSPIPKNPEELDERIAVLSSLLDNPGPKSLEYHLARLFFFRNQRNDLRRALHHANRSKSDYHVFSWLLCSDILCKMERHNEAISVLKDGIRRVPPEKGLVQLYDKCSQLLYENNLQNDAIDLLKQGINKVPADKAVVSLYERCGRFLYQMGDREAAINIIQNGMAKIPADKALVNLYTLCGDLLSQAGSLTKAIDVIKEGIRRIPPNYALSDLYYKACELLLKTNQTQDAITVLREGIKVIPEGKGLGVAYARYIKLLYHGGEIEDAMVLAKEGINRTPPDKGALTLYLYYAKLLLMSNQQGKAMEVLVNGIENVPTNQNAALVDLLVVLYASKRRGNIVALIETLNNIDSAHYVIAQVLQYQSQQLWVDAASFAAHNRDNSSLVNHYLVCLEAFSWLCAGQPTRGLSVLAIISGGSRHHVQWLRAFLMLRMGNIGEAEKIIENAYGEAIGSRFIDEAYLLKLWDNDNSTLAQYGISYFFPILPTSLTGLDKAIFRVPYSSPVLEGYGYRIFGNYQEQNNMDNKTNIIGKKVFISYSSKQKAHADDLHYMLEKAGYEPILDNYDIKGGQRISDTIASLIREANYFVLLLTEESLASSWVLSEVTLAYSFGLLKDERLLPVQLGEIGDDIANSIPWIPRNSYNWLDGRSGLRPVVDWLENTNALTNP